MLTSAPPPVFLNKGMDDIPKHVFILNGSGKNHHRMNAKSDMDDSSSRRRLTSKKTKQLSVRFSADDLVSTNIYNELNEDGLLNELTWYSPKELRVFLYEAEATLMKYVGALKGQQQFNLEKYCSRGLVEGPGFTMELQRLYHGHEEFAKLVVQSGPCFDRREVVEAVLTQHEEQKELGINDPKCLRTRAQSFTQFAQDKAGQQAEADYEEARCVWLEDEQCRALLDTIGKKIKSSGVIRRTNSQSSFRNSLMHARRRQVTDPSSCSNSRSATCIRDSILRAKRRDSMTSSPSTPGIRRNKSFSQSFSVAQHERESKGGRNTNMFAAKINETLAEVDGLLQNDASLDF